MNRIIRVNRNVKTVLNQDVDVLELREGHYTECENVDFNNNSTTFADTPTLGNSLKYEIPDKLIQNQRVRIFFNGVYGNSINLVFKNINGQVINNLTQPTLTNDLIGVKQAMVQLANGLSWAATVFNDTNALDFIDIEIALSFSDWTIEVQNDSLFTYQTRILQEALSGSEVGTVIPVSKKEINGKLFIISTVGSDEVRKLNEIQLITFSGVSNSTIQLSVFNHGLQTLDTITVVGCSFVPANGKWVVQVVDGNNFYLIGSVGLVATQINPTGAVFTGREFYTEIGVQEEFSDLYFYKRLVGTKKFGVITTKQPDLDGHLGNDRYNLYFTDKYNDPRVFYYKGEFAQDGAINVLNSDGLYNYESIFGATINILPQPKVLVEFKEQKQTGGSNQSGNYVYGIRLKTETNSPTSISVLTNAIPVYAPIINTNPVTQLFGTTGQTGKINVLRVTGIPEGEYSFIELIAFQYSSSGTESVITPIIVSQTKLLSNQTEIELEHNGNETVLLFTLQESQLINNSFRLASNNVIIDNRLVYSDLVVDEETDIQDWVNTFNYSIVLEPKQASFYSSTANRTTTSGEYYKPEDVVEGGGYMPYEWERFYIVARFKNGNLSSGTFFADVRFLPSPEYDPNEFIDTNKRDRRDLTQDQYLQNVFGNNDGQGGELFQLGLIIPNIDWGFPINGLPASDVIDSIYIAKRPTVKEVLGAGKLIASITQDLTLTGELELMPSLFEFIFTPNVTKQPDISRMLPSTYPKRYYAMVCPDWMFNNDYPEYQAGDEIIATSSNVFEETYLSSSLLRLNFNYEKSSDNIFVQTTRVPITDSEFIDNGQQYTFPNSVPLPPSTTPLKFNKRFFALCTFIDGVVLETDIDLDFYFKAGATPTLPINSFLNAYYFRRRVNKYGNIEDGELEFTGTNIRPDEIKTIYGGKVFNQQTTVRTWSFIGNDPVSRSVGIVISSQNRVNTNLRTFDDNVNNKPLGPSTYDLTNWLLQIGQEPWTYNFSYQFAQGIQVVNPFNSNLFTAIKLLARKAFSLNKPENSTRDFFRQFLPLNFQDNDNNYGRIVHTHNLNGDLITIQERGVTREYTVSQGKLTSSDAGQILIGDGAFLSRKGDFLSVYGTTHKWSIVEGKTQGGKQTLLWLSTDFNAIIRYGADGLVNQSLRNNMQTFLRENTQFVKDKYTPAAGQGVHGVWDERLKNYILTARAWTEAATPWIINAPYFVDDLVIFGTTFGVPQIYECIVQNAGVPQPPIQRPDLWRKVDLRENKYYNVWTLVFNEQKDGFVGFYTFYPKIYLNQFDRYFSSNPEREGEIWRHFDGEEIVFYDQEHLGFKEYVINQANSLNKKFSAIGIVSLLKPFRILFNTLFISNIGQEERNTVLERDEFETRQTVNYSPIKNTLDQNGSNSGDTADMRGIYLKIKLFFKAREKQKVNDIDVSVRMSTPNSNKIS